MTERQANLLEAALDRLSDIRPCDGKTWAECMTEHRGEMVLWYNDRTNGTHLFKESDYA